ncbi:MAG: phosphoribosyl-AMP cyclohydrolase, partial [Planctomycetota bacterium]|nr:phosphoribosyl-AMP cyclohydrolase [Planctomycetota bacterium]
MSGSMFGQRISVEQVEEGQELAPKFDAQGLIPVITTDFTSGELLMHGYMNEEALRKTIELGEAVY